MKKITLLLLFCVMFLGAFTQDNNLSLKATKIVVSVGEETVSRDVDVNISLDTVNQVCTIYSKKVQRIRYTITKVYIEEEYKVVEADGIDANEEPVLFRFDTHISKNIIYIAISYAEVAYVYKCHLL